ncbi:MAG: class III poly(R)-hydroxyalkanoic acid synthase subunit PhaE [Thermodesulfobacteriota bacterium]
MNWTEQTQAMLRSWTETQKKLWEGWAEAAQRSAPAGGEAPAWAEWGQRWRDLARQSLEGLGASTTGVPREVAERLFTGEDVFLRFVEQALAVMHTVAPKIDAGEDWADLLRRQFRQIKETMTQAPAPWFTPEAAAAMARDMPELWKLYAQELQKLGAPWLESLRGARGHLGEAMSGDRQAVVRMYNLFMDTFGSTAGKFAAAPAIGYTREFQEKVTSAFETWVEVRRTEVDFHTEMVNTGLRAMEGLLRELVEKSERGEKIESLRALFDLWVATAEKTYFEMASTDAFAEVQGRFVNAAMQHRIRERELMDALMKSLHLPTRRELDDAYRHLHDLKNEVRALRREVSQMRAAPATAPATPAPPAAPGAAAPAADPAPPNATTRRKSSSRARSSASRTGKKEG